ncbi:MAG: N-acetyltransferase [Myxococcales bacterium]|nr:N-acetyltransferase [Myxococcales bacterium]
MIAVRRAVLDDVPAMLGFANWAAEHTVANLATAPEPLSEWSEAFASTEERYPWILATDAQGKPLGFAKAGPHKARGAYAWSADVTVYVAPEAHGRGVGTRLYEVLVPTLRAQGYALLVAGITLPNVASEKLHARFGFERCGTFHRVGFKNGKWHDVGYWELAVRPGTLAPGPIVPAKTALHAAGIG